ncbi:MAG TPA: CAP domain-containing protein [Solirubrobacteraceae bacterium]|nr:CAP domain-containing protein [Solirubrobacteraceae bacterium]
MPRTACLAAASAALLATLAAPAYADCPDADLQADEQTVALVREAMLCVINERRAEVGRQPLRASRHLQRSATAHSRDMVEHSYLAHEEQGRPTLLARVRGAGYFDGTATALFSENIGVAPLGGATARVLVDAWMTSPEHRANVLHPMFADLGVGSAFAEPDAAFYPEHRALVVTTDFGQRVLLSTPAGRRIVRRCRARRQSARRAEDGSATTRARFCRKRRR